MTAELVTVVQLEAWIRLFGDMIADQRAYLTELDSAIGDADHGINMDRGMQAVRAKLDASTVSTADELFKLVGMTLVSSIGGASGPLYGTMFLRFGAACGPRAELSANDVVKAFRAGIEGLVARGKPELGDKTMFDSLHPALEALDAAAARGSSPGEAFAAAALAAAGGRDATTGLVARKGRASYLGERSAGHQDPGATSAALLFDAAAKIFES